MVGLDARQRRNLRGAQLRRALDALHQGGTRERKAPASARLPNLERAWAANRRKHHALQVLKEQKERFRELEKRRLILANSARETLVLRPVRGDASVNVLAARNRFRRL